MNLDEAMAVIEADREEKREARIAERRKFVGRYFKYRNCYSCPGPDDYFWLYAKATDVDDVGNVVGLTFQRDKNGKIDVEFDERILSVESGWIEITVAEFQREGRKIAARVNRALVGTARQK